MKQRCRVTSKKHMNSHEIYKKTYFYEYKLFCLKERRDLSTSIKVPFSSKRVCFVQWTYFLPMYGCYLRLFPWGKFHSAVLLGRFFNNIMTKKQLYSFVGADKMVLISFGLWLCFSGHILMVSECEDNTFTVQSPLNCSKISFSWHKVSSYCVTTCR